MLINEARYPHEGVGQHAAHNLPLVEIFDHYPHEVVLAILIITLLFALVCQAQRMRQRAERSERDKTMFLAVMSHEIRSPLNTILAAVELLRTTCLDKQQQRYANLAHSSADSLLTLLNNVLDISRLDAGQMKLECEPVNISCLVRQIVDQYSLHAQEKNIFLSVNGEATPLWLMLDGTRLRQILHNLISNAIKFTEAGGVEVKFFVADAQLNNYKRLHIIVTDTGIGIAKQAQARLFQPYVQTDKTYKRSGGTGLGLAICREILKLMHGTITLNSDLGKGTQVELTLLADAASPVTVPAEPSMPAVLSSMSECASKLRILVVEDTPTNRAVLQAQIEEFGCTPVIARDGAQAQACFEQGVFDLVLMDCYLPDLDGYSLARIFRTIEETEGRTRCPIIAVSASTDGMHISLCFDSGMDAILSKPISLGKLKEAIELWCGVSLPFSPYAFVRETYDNVVIKSAIEQDLCALLEGVVLRKTEEMRRALHRMRGAALSVGWSEVASASERIEDLLNMNTPLEDPAYRSSIALLVSRFRAETF
ncbi:ATP-binding protein [Pseudomonas aeruginosa]|uniref:ATP-binding protein n=3 Tax=Pseudomonas aeruginosa TaxID=287 RepID=UPI000EB55BB6|nr:ATP-binding protein [Pseudomonas aeruginosa]